MVSIMFRRNKNITIFDKIVFSICLVIPILQYSRSLFVININIFHSFEAGIAKAISSFINKSKQFSSTKFDRLLYKLWRSL